MNEAIRFQNVVAGELTEGVSFAVREGSLAAIITSRQDENDQLARLMLGLSKPVGGSIMILGEDVSASEKTLNDLRKRVAVVNPAGGLVSNLKVWENLVLPLEYHAVYPRSEIEERGLAILRRVGYSGKLMELPGHLSPYEKRLICLCRAMLTEPRLIIYNAILAGLGSEEKDCIISTAMEYHRGKPGITSLFMTPNPETIKNMVFDSRILLKGRASHD